MGLHNALLPESTQAPYLWRVVMHPLSLISRIPTVSCLNHHNIRVLSQMMALYGDPSSRRFSCVSPVDFRTFLSLLVPDLMPWSKDSQVISQHLIQSIRYWPPASLSSHNSPSLTWYWKTMATHDLSGPLWQNNISAFELFFHPWLVITPPLLQSSILLISRAVQSSSIYMDEVFCWTIQAVWKDGY